MYSEEDNDHEINEIILYDTSGDILFITEEDIETNENVQGELIIALEELIYLRKMVDHPKQELHEYEEKYHHGCFVISLKI